MFGMKPPTLLETIFDQVLVAVAAVDAQRRVVYANEHAFRIFGAPQSANVSQLEALAGQCRYSDWSGNEIPFERLPIVRVLAGEDIQPHNMKVELPDGTYKWLHVTNQRFSVMGLSGALMVATDETREVELQRVAADVQKIEVLSLLAGSLAHNFNNILQIIDLSVAACLADPDAGPDSRAKLQQILDASHHAGNLIRRLAQFSRTQHLHPMQLSINSLLHESLDLIDPLISGEIAIVTRFHPNLPEVEIDPVEMQQVVLNLMLNARDAMPNGGELTVTTDVRVRPSDAIGGGIKRWVTITVSDTGVGMPDSIQDHIFEPFFTTKPGGTGLGLSSALGIVRQHGGDIKVQSAVGKGTSFTVYLRPCTEQEPRPSPHSA